MIKAKCALCDSAETISYGAGDKVLQCRQCGIIFLAPNQAPPNLDAYYQNNPFYAQNASNPDWLKRMAETAQFYLRVITRHLDHLPGQLLVDIGSNYGVLVEEAKRLGFQALGLEKNNFLVEAGRERGLDISTADLAELEPGRALNVITVMHVLEHLADPRSLIEEAYLKLVPNGLLVVGVPNIKSYLAKKDVLSWRYIALEHLFYFSTDTLEQLLNQAGFEIIESRTDGSNLYDLSLKKLMHYLVGPALVRDRFQMKNWTGRDNDRPVSVSWWKKILKSILVFAIKGLKREDFILIIAKKSNRF